MILFCDTSALVKLYVNEADSALLIKHVGEAEAAAVCRIAWAEVHAAFARRAREVPADTPALEQAKSTLAADWARFLILEVNQALIERAGEFADIFALRAYDAVQLAAADVAAKISGMPVLFACFDMRLNKAAKTLGMQLLRN